jgi:hypothetical protein
MHQAVIRRPVQLAKKTSLFVRIWAWFVLITLMLRIRPLPELVRRLTVTPMVPRPQTSPRRLGYAVWRSLSVGRYRPRCLTASLILYRLLAEQGHSGEVVLGLPSEAFDKKAHAWVEIDGIDVGPPPGKHGHQELARYGANASPAVGVDASGR